MNLISNNTFILVFILGGFSLLNSCNSSPTSNDTITTQSFDEGLKTHLSSVISKNLSTFEGTLSTTTPLYMIFPDGEMIQNVDTIVSLHEEWFAGTDWKFEYNILRTEETAEMAFALLDIDYHKKDKDGNDVFRQFYLNLVFKLIDGKWKLIHDQNTVHE